MSKAQTLKRILLISTLVLTTLGSVLAVSATSGSDKNKKKKKKAKAKAVVAAVVQTKKSGELDLQRQRFAVPKSSAQTPQVKEHSLGTVKPPRSNEFYENGTKEAEYESLVDQEIKALYRLSQTNKKSPNRGEIWLRLGEQYVEKSRLVEFREQAEYDTKLKEYNEKKTGMHPKLNLGLSHEYNQKAVQLYEWFVTDFPKDPKVDQALFFLGYNHFELGNAKLGEKYYLDLVKRFPESPYVTESHFALGEYYFENEEWKPALDNYLKVIAVKRARLNAFALYKSAWCFYRLGRVQASLQALERVIRISRASERDEQISGRRAVNKVRLANEALKDYVPFYAEAGNPTQAAQEFDRLTNGDHKLTQQMLERLAYIYADAGNRAAATAMFRQLIAMNPTGERAAEYQYQIVLTHTTAQAKEYRAELEMWLDNFGPNSDWAKANAQNTKLVSDVARLQETTVRNYVLQLHGIAQNSRAEYSQRAASSAYALYFKYFPDNNLTVEMRFFHAELLFDMDRYEEAAKEYAWVAENDKKGTYKDKAILNALLALEKDLPDPKLVDAKRGNSLTEIPLDPQVERFATAALTYIRANPNAEKASDVERRLGVLYYSYNHFDQAVTMFEKILKDHPKSANAEIAGNLLLDIYKLKNDMVGLTEKGKELLANPDIASSKFGQQIRAILEKAGYLRAEKVASTGDYAKAAKEFESFASSYHQSDLAAAARFKAATNYEKAGDTPSAIRMYGQLMATPTTDAKIRTIQSDSRNNLARLYQQTGQLEQAAKQYYEFASSNPKDAKAVNGFYNAAILWEALNENASAAQAYQAYFARTASADKVEVLYAEAEMERKKGASAKALTLYDKYLKMGPKNQGHAVNAAFQIADISRKGGRAAQAKLWYQRTLDLYKKVTAKAAKDESVGHAAEARFELAQETMNQMSNVRFSQSDKQQAQAAKQMMGLKDKYINEMKDVIRFDNAPMIVAALASTGRAFEKISDSFSHIPAPKGFSPEDAAKYKALIQNQIDSLKNEARKSYRAAIEKSKELEAFTDWTQVARNALMELDPQATDTHEIAVEAHGLDWMGL